MGVSTYYYDTISSFASRCLASRGVVAEQGAPHTQVQTTMAIRMITGKISFEQWNSIHIHTFMETMSWWNKQEYVISNWYYWYVIHDAVIMSEPSWDLPIANDRGMILASRHQCSNKKKHLFCSSNCNMPTDATFVLMLPWHTQRIKSTREALQGNYHYSVSDLAPYGPHNSCDQNYNIQKPDMRPTCR